jgi:hypothetical protein
MPYRYVARKAKQFFLHNVLHVDDTPHRIALGVAIGMFWAWTPTVGIQMTLTIVFAFLLRANKLVGLPWVWISNPATMLPMYYGNYRLGRLLLGGTWPEIQFAHVIRTPGWFRKFWALMQETLHVAWPLWLGSVIVALAWAVPTYFIIRWAVIAYRARRRVHLAAEE